MNGEFTSAPAANRDDTARWRGRGLVLAGFTALSSLFALVGYTPLHFVSVNLVQALVLVGLAIVASVGCLMRIPALLLAAGVVFIVFGVLRLFTYGQTIGILSGSVNAAALMVGLGTAFIAIWITSRPLPEKR